MIKNALYFNNPEIVPFIYCTELYVSVGLETIMMTNLTIHYLFTRIYWYNKDSKDQVVKFIFLEKKKKKTKVT